MKYDQPPSLYSHSPPQTHPHKMLVWPHTIGMTQLQYSVRLLQEFKQVTAVKKICPAFHLHQYPFKFLNSFHLTQQTHSVANRGLLVNAPGLQEGPFPDEGDSSPSSGPALAVVCSPPTTTLCFQLVGTQIQDEDFPSYLLGCKISFLPFVTYWLC